MRILWVCGSRIFGGAEQVCSQVLEILSERSHSIAALIRTETTVADKIRDFARPVYRAKFRGSLDAISIGRVFHAASDFKPDVMLVTTPDEWVLAALIPRRFVDVPLIFVRHMSLRLSPGVRWLADKRAAAVVAVSEAVKVALLGRVGVRAELIRVIPNPVRFSIRSEILSSDERAERRVQLRLPAQGQWIGFFGGNDPQKGIGDLMDATRQIRRAGVDLRLLICGRVDTRFPKTVASWISDYGLTDCAYHPPNIPDVEKAMCAMDSVVVPTHNSLGEGLPLIALEAMACGTPVIGYATAGVVEAIGGAEEAGLLARADDPTELARAINLLLSNSALAQQLAHRGLIRARDRFDPQRAATEYERILTAVVNSNRQ